MAIYISTNIKSHDSAVAVLKTLSERYRGLYLSKSSENFDIVIDDSEFILTESFTQEVKELITKQHKNIEILKIRHTAFLLQGAKSFTSILFETHVDILKHNSGLPVMIKKCLENIEIRYRSYFKNWKERKIQKFNEKFNNHNLIPNQLIQSNVSNRNFNNFEAETNPVLFKNNAPNRNELTQSNKNGLWNNNFNDTNFDDDDDFLNPHPQTSSNINFNSNFIHFSFNIPKKTYSQIDYNNEKISLESDINLEEEIINQKINIEQEQILLAMDKYNTAIQLNTNKKIDVLALQETYFKLQPNQAMTTHYVIDDKDDQATTVTFIRTENHGRRISQNFLHDNLLLIDGKLFFQELFNSNLKGIPLIIEYDNSFDHKFFKITFSKLSIKKGTEEFFTKDIQMILFNAGLANTYQINEITYKLSPLAANQMKENILSTSTLKFFSKKNVQTNLTWKT